MNGHGVILSKLRCVSILENKRKFKLSANCRDTMDDVGPINGAAVPCVGGSAGSRNEVRSIAAVILGVG